MDRLKALFKKLPPWAWILILAGVLLVAIYIRHRQDQAAIDAANQDQTDPNNPTADQGYFNTGYPTTAMPVDLGGGAGDPGGSLPGAGGAPSPGDPGGVGTGGSPAPDPGQTDPGATTPDPTAHPDPLTPTATGGGAPTRPATAHHGHSLTGHRVRGGGRGGRGQGGRGSGRGSRGGRGRLGHAEHPHARHHHQEPPPRPKPKPRPKPPPPPPPPRRRYTRWR